LFADWLYGGDGGGGGPAGGSPKSPGGAATSHDTGSANPDYFGEDYPDNYDDVSNT